MKDFKDNFSKHSSIYSKYRPNYPIEMFEYLISLTKEHNLAWDCGTGNGQSALSLANYFDLVYASDPSEQQIKNAKPHKKIIYKIEKAEKSELKDHSVDLITISQALHWFDFEAFYREANRVLKEIGVIAAWTYGLPKISIEIDKIVQFYHDTILGEYWPKEHKLVTTEYTTIPFPFEEIPSPDFKIQKSLSLNQLKGLLKSWSATQRYIEKNGTNPIEKIEADLTKLWGNRDLKVSNWKIILRAGRPFASNA